MDKIWYFVIVSVFLAGCASLTSPAGMHEPEATKSYWFDYDVTRRGTVLFDNTKSWSTCSEPAPDAAISLVASLEGSLKVADKGEAIGKGELTQSIVKLAERTQMVLFLRESLFRLCELSTNQKLPASDCNRSRF